MSLLFIQARKLVVLSIAALISLAAAAGPDFTISGQNSVRVSSYLLAQKGHLEYYIRLLQMRGMYVSSGFRAHFLFW